MDAPVAAERRALGCGIAEGRDDAVIGMLGLADLQNRATAEAAPLYALQAAEKR